VCSLKVVWLTAVAHQPPFITRPEDALQGVERTGGIGSASDTRAIVSTREARMADPDEDEAVEERDSDAYNEGDDDCLRIPAMPITDSGRSRSAVPRHADHPGAQRRW
jgi:hypothetical protein